MQNPKIQCFQFANLQKSAKGTLRERIHLLKSPYGDIKLKILIIMWFRYPKFASLGCGMASPLQSQRPGKSAKKWKLLGTEDLKRFKIDPIGGSWYNHINFTLLWLFFSSNMNLFLFSFKPLNRPEELKKIVENFKVHRKYEATLEALLNVDPGRTGPYNRTKHQAKLLKQHVIFFFKYRLLPKFFVYLYMLKVLICWNVASFLIDHRAICLAV